MGTQYNPCQPVVSLGKSYLRLYFYPVHITSGQSEIEDIKADLKQCANSNSDVNDCLKELAQRIKPYLKTGVPELNIPASDPLKIDLLSFDLKNALIDVDVVFTENEVSGLSEHELVYINADKKAKTIAMKMFLPKSTVEGVAKLAVKTINGVERLVIVEDPKITIELGDLNIKLDNLFGGKAPALAKTVDKFLNQNTEKFIDDFQDAITTSVSGFLTSFYNSAVANIDASVFQ